MQLNVESGSSGIREQALYNEGLSMAEKTIEKFLARAVRLYEQEQGEPLGSPWLGLYVQRWVSWVNAGLKI